MPEGVLSLDFARGFSVRGMLVPSSEVRQASASQSVLSVADLIR